MLTAFDVGFGILVLISAILATARGLTREVLSLATWAGSAAIAIFMWQYHPEIAQGFIKDPTVAAIATVVVSFLVSLIVLHLITMRIADFVVDSRIGALDRALGFVFGVLRGVLIAVVVVIFGLWLLQANGPDGRKALPDWAAQAKSLPMLENMGDSLIAALPQNLDDQVTNLLKRGSHAGDNEPLDGSGDNGTDDGGLDNGPNSGGADNSGALPATPDTAPASPAAPAAPGNSGSPDVTTVPGPA